MSGPLILGIETSCDETGVGVVRGSELLADSVASSVELHARYGGVVPEVAARAHLEAMVPMVTRACEMADIKLRDVDAIAVTVGPGLAGALLVGVSAAKAYALALDKPLLGTHHLAAHVAVDTLEHGPLPEPCIAMLVSGGHSSLLLVEDIASKQAPIKLGETVDDAVGEAFDKVARVLGLGFPGGPLVDKAARDGNPSAIPFPRAMPDSDDFSFSGLKTAVARWVEGRQRDGLAIPLADVCASFQEAAVEVLLTKALRAAKREGVDHLVIGGGVTANSRLRSMAQQRCAEAGVVLRIPRPSLCTDNGAMVAALGSLQFARGVEATPLDVSADSNLPLAIRRQLT